MKTCNKCNCFNDEVTDKCVIITEDIPCLNIKKGDCYSLLVASLIEKVCVEASDEGIDLKCLDLSCENVTFSVALQKTIDYVCSLTGSQIKSEADLYCLNNETECENNYTIDYSIVENGNKYKIIYTTNIKDFQSTNIDIIKGDGSKIINKPIEGSLISELDKNDLPLIISISGTNLNESINKDIYISEFNLGSYCLDIDCNNFTNNTSSNLTVDDKISIIAKKVCKSEKKKTFKVNACNGEEVEYDQETLFKHLFTKSCDKVYTITTTETDECGNIIIKEIEVQDFIDQTTLKCERLENNITTLQTQIQELKDLVSQLNAVEVVSTDSTNCDEGCYTINSYNYVPTINEVSFEITFNCLELPDQTSNFIPVINNTISSTIELNAPFNSFSLGDINITLTQNGPNISGLNQC